MHKFCLYDTNIISHYLNIKPTEADKHRLSLALSAHLQKEQYKILVPTVAVFELLQCNKSVEAAEKLNYLIGRTFLFADFNYAAASLAYSIRDGIPFRQYINAINPNKPKEKIKVDLMVFATAIAFNVGLIISDDHDLVSIARNFPDVKVKSYNDFPLQPQLDLSLTEIAD
mgnify:CR=1 FL=1